MKTFVMMCFIKTKWPMGEVFFCLTWVGFGERERDRERRNGGWIVGNMCTRDTFDKNGNGITPAFLVSGRFV